METVFDTERDERTLHQIPPDEYTAHTQANGINTSENPPFSTPPLKRQQRIGFVESVERIVFACIVPKFKGAFTGRE